MKRFCLALLVGALSLQTVPGAQAQTVTPVAGVPSSLSGIADFALAPDGRFVIVSGSRLGILDAAGNLSFVAGTGPTVGPGSTPGNRDIRGVAISETGRIVVSASSRAQVYEFTAPATLTPIAGTGTPGSSGDGNQGTAAQLAWPGGLAFDTMGNLYIADANRVRKLSTSGIISTVATSSVASFSGPINLGGIAVDAAGTVYATLPTFPVPSLWRSNGAGGFDRLTEGGIISLCSANTPATEQSVAGPPRVGPDGLVYLANGTCISRLTTAGRLVRIAGDTAPGDTSVTTPLPSARFAGINSLDWDAAGNLYAHGNGRIWRFSGIPATVDSPPVANAGPDQTVVQGDDVLLDGRGSTDPDGDPIQYSWVFASRPAASIATLRSATTATPGFIADAAGNFVLELTASNGGGAATDTVVIEVQSLAEYANLALGDALRTIDELPDEAWRAPGLRVALRNQVEQALVAALAGDWDRSARKLDRAIARVDGCIANGRPDGAGAGSDWIIDCGYQADPFFHLWSVRRRIE